MRSHILLGSLLVCAGLHAQVTVINGASFRAEQPVTGGSWAAAFGDLTGQAVAQAPGYPLPKTLGGVTVTVDGVDAALYYVSPTQINFLIPYSAAPGLRPVVVKSAGVTLNGNVRVITTGPGLFIKDTSGDRIPKGAILNQDQTENTEANPAIRGQVISIYGTGPGALTQTVGDGIAAPSDPLATTSSTPQVFIAGVLATVQYSGLAPGFAGLWQVNVVVPDLSFLRGKVAVQAYVDGVDSNEVGLFVAN